MCITFSSRQESQSRGSDETLSSPRSPEGIYDNISLTSYVVLPLGTFWQTNNNEIDVSNFDLLMGLQKSSK